MRVTGFHKARASLLRQDARWETVLDGILYGLKQASAFANQLAIKVLKEELSCNRRK